jgi:hypothetical protein
MIFRKFDVAKAYERLGLFCTVELSEVARAFGVPIFKIVTYFKGNRISEEPFSEELFEQKRKEGIVIKVIETVPEEFEKIPYNKILLGRLEVPRLGLGEEEV